MVDELVAHAVEDFPREACGVLVGPAEECRFERLVRMTNVADGDDRYAFDPGGPARALVGPGGGPESVPGASTTPTPPLGWGIPVKGGHRHGRLSRHALPDRRCRPGGAGLPH